METPGNKNKSSEKLQVQEEYEAGSVWEGLLYVLIMIVVLGGPLLVPGVTIKGWAIGLFGSVIFIYIVICLVGIWKGFMRGKR